jgi:hypothetical protein
MNDRDPQYQVDQAVYGLHKAVSLLVELRHRNDTADMVMEAFDEISTAIDMGENLLGDLIDADCFGTSKKMEAAE